MIKERKKQKSSRIKNIKNWCVGLTLVLASTFWACGNDRITDTSTAEKSSNMVEYTQKQNSSEPVQSINQTEAKSAIDTIEEVTTKVSIDWTIENTEETEVSTEAYQSQLEVRFIGQEKYVGQSLSPAELEVDVIWSDGRTERNPAGWTMDELWKLLEAGENVYTIHYMGLTQTISIQAQNTTSTGNTVCKVNEASDLSYNGKQVVSQGLEYLNISIDNYGIISPYEGHSAKSASYVRLIYGQIGLALPYELEAQMTYGSEVRKEELRVGDLVFIYAASEELKDTPSDEAILAGIYLGGDWVLSCAEDGRADFYWLNPVTCRRLYANTCGYLGEETFIMVMSALRKQGEYGSWVASYVDDVPFMIGKVRKFTFTVNLLEYENGYYKTYFSYDEFLLHEAFVKQWQKQFIKGNKLCEVMKNGEYIRYDANGNYYFKIEVTPEVWASLTPGIHGEYWNLDFEHFYDR